MKRVILGLVILGLMAIPCLGLTNGMKLEASLEKQVNGGYLAGFTVNQDVTANLPFLPGAFLNTGVYADAPRGVLNPLVFDHSYGRFEVGGKCKLFGGDLKFSTLLDANWKTGENLWGNKISYGWEK